MTSQSNNFEMKKVEVSKSNVGLRSSQSTQHKTKALEFDSDAWFATPELRESSNGLLLELSVTWDTTLLDISHYKHPRRITFGSDPRADFCYSLTSSLEGGHIYPLFPLIEVARTGDYLLCFDPDMDGFVEENGERHSFLSLVQDGKAHSFARTGLFFFPLLPGTEVQLRCQEHTKIQIKFVSSAPQPQKWLRSLDTKAPVLSFSIFIHLFMTFLAITSLTSSYTNTTKPVHEKVSRQSQMTRENVSTRIMNKLCRRYENSRETTNKLHLTGLERNLGLYADLNFYCDSK